MKFKKKCKMYSSLSSSSSSSSYKDPDTVLKLLPLTILALALPLPAQDQEVIAYMITRSIFAINATNPSSEKKNRLYCKRKPNQKGPLFECGCFDCYTSFWYRWDSSPNRDLIHQAIEAFEEHLLQNESLKIHNKGKKKGKAVMNRFESTTSFEKELENNIQMSVPKTESGNIENNGDECVEYKVEQEVINRSLELEVVTVQVLQAPVSSGKGFARKVLPDVVGLLNSRLWSLWSPSI
ncbi:ATP-dependent tryptophan/phenylalanine/tyrosine adenylase [Melia azedarach]|uniref:ATP-dependent tryptophan/phenylalanine/tyrosine adenylase n=1 Tax=Melia azedarach TaxID=155640 RepID=A0ACC1Z0I8_MELAZ|nr:ATP-dependent tryptophan/phenylalanine/tyrosine adenylase [Melia azedarach]